MHDTCAQRTLYRYSTIESLRIPYAMARQSSDSYSSPAKQALTQDILLLLFQGSLASVGAAAPRYPAAVLGLAKHVL